jgi:chromosome segregation ATPase
LTAQYDEQSQELKAAQQRNEDLSVRLKDHQHRLENDTLESRRQEQLQLIDNLKQELADTHQQLTRQENETDKTEKALAELRGKSAAMEEQLKTSTDAQKSLQIDIEDLNKMITAKEIELQSSQTEQLRLLERLEEMESSLAQQLQSTQALSDEKQALLNQLHKEQQAMTRSEAACRKLESEIKAQQQVYEQQLESAREDISAYQSHMDEAAENIQTLTLQLESLKEIEQLYHITLKDLESSKQEPESSNWMLLA